MLINWKKWIIILLVFLVVVVVIGELLSLRLVNQKLSLNNNYRTRSHFPAVSPTPDPQISPVTSLPVSAPHQSGTTVIFSNPDGSIQWRQGMFFYSASGSATLNNPITPVTLVGEVIKINGDVFTIRPVLEIRNEFGGSVPNIKVKTLPTATFWVPTFSKESGVFATVTSKKEISLQNIEIGDVLTFLHLGVSGGIYTATEVNVSKKLNVSK